MPKIDFEELIVFEDDHFILINKPPHIATLDDRKSSLNILKLAKAYHEEAQAVHRLDKETSGVLALAKNPDAYRHLALQFEKREVAKIYHAVVEGVHKFEDAAVDKPIYALSSKGLVKIDFERGKDSLTFFKTIKAYRRHTLVKCLPVTGRMHQIRIHLSLLGAPIVSDEHYGASMLYLSSLKKNYNLKKWTEEQPLIKRVALHAYSLEFTLIDGERKAVEAPYPKDFNVLVKQLEKYSV